MTTLTIGGLETLLAKAGLSVPIPSFENANVLVRPLDVARLYLARALQEIAPEHATRAYVSLQESSNIDHGDIHIIVPRLDHEAEPELFGLDLMQRFPKSTLYLLPIPEGVQLRVFLNPQNLSGILLPYINDRGDTYGFEGHPSSTDSSSATSSEKRTALIEFSSPSIAGEFQGKHLRSTLLGAQVSNLYESLGWKVQRINFLGDWGMPIALLGAVWEEHGSHEALDNDPEAHLLAMKEKAAALLAPEESERKKAREIGGDTAAREVETRGWFAARNTFFKRMEEGDEKALAFWQRFREITVESYRWLYAQLNVRFDEYDGESKVSADTMDEVVQLMRDRGLVEESGGALIIDLKKHGSSGTAIIRSQVGNSTYLLRGISAVIQRHKKHGFDSMVYVVAADSYSTHFSRMVKILDLIGLGSIGSKLQHVSFSKNTTIADSMAKEHSLAEILKRTRSSVQSAAEEGGLCASDFGDNTSGYVTTSSSALFAHGSSARRVTDLSFEDLKIASFELNSGLDALGWYTSLKALDSLPADFGNLSLDNEETFQDESSSTLLRLLAHWPEVVQAANKATEPAVIMTFLAVLTSKLSKCVGDRSNMAHKGHVQNQLLNAAKFVLGNGLGILNMTARERDRDRDSGVSF